MRFRVDVEALNEALGVVSVVQPRDLGDKGGGYLFVVKDLTCSIYSMDTTRKAKATVAVSDVEGEGAFIYPVNKVAPLKYLSGTATFEAKKASDGRFLVECESEDGARQEFATLDPNLLKSFEEELLGAEQDKEYPVAVLREGLATLKGFIMPAEDHRGAADDAFKTVQLFGDGQEQTRKGDGTIYASNKVQAGYFHCDALKGKAFSLAGVHLSALLSFLAKCDGEIQVHTSKLTNFVTNSKGQAFGWAQQTKTFDKYAYYGLGSDGYVFMVPKANLVKALRYIRSGLAAKADKIRLQYKAEDKTIRILASEDASKAQSQPIMVKTVEETDPPAGGSASNDFGVNMNVDHLLEAVDPMRGNEIMLRVSLLEKGGETNALFRTIEEFSLNDQGKVVIAPGPNEKVFQCQVTRYMPSRK